MMQRIVRSRVTVPIVTAVVAAACVGGIAYAAIPNSSTGIISGCYSTAVSNKGVLRIIDTQAGQICTANEKLISWDGKTLNWRGAWSSVVAYARNDVVSSGGSSYLARIANTNVAVTNAADWALLAQQGVKGATGPTGPTGPAGVAGGTGPAGPAGNATAPVIEISPDHFARTFCLSQFLTCTKGSSIDPVANVFIGLSSQSPQWSAGITVGKYLVTYHATVVNFGPFTTTDIFRCRVQTQDQPVSPSFSPWDSPIEIGAASAVQLTNPGSAVSELSGEMVVDLNQSFYNTHAHIDIGAICWHDNLLPSGVYYIDLGATLAIQPVS